MRAYRQWAGTTLGCALLLSGCANPMSPRSDHEQRTERTLVDHHLVIDAGEPAQLQQSRRRIRVTEQRTFEVTDFEVTRRYDRYTPYQPWRKVYEIPAGAVALVGGIGANVANVFALGHLPSSMTHDWLSYGVSGLNPFMNMPSNGRAEQNLAGIDEVQTDKRQEVVTQPWAQRPVEVSAGRELYSLATDPKGYLHLNLLDNPFSERSLRGLTRVGLSVENDDDHSRAEAWLPLAPGLQAKLVEARGLIYDDLEDDEVSQWVGRVKRLSQLGLPDDAHELEQSLIELTQNDPQLQHEFLTALRQGGR
ncbi:hypothetical protein [Pseudomonas sp. NPDC007930]|uniref:hypothetical protein n=1 Tax=Pseudomonas sp. NPDC007930 TaxID=3364417 RepID=UPI0036EBFDBE